MITGKITKIIQKDGYGFIRTPELPRDVFLHAKNCVLGTIFDSLMEGQEVAFDVKETPKGFVAVGVTLNL